MQRVPGCGVGAGRYEAQARRRAAGGTIKAASSAIEVLSQCGLRCGTAGARYKHYRQNLIMRTTL